jgi:hypothetical protein
VQLVRAVGEGPEDRQREDGEMTNETPAPGSPEAVAQGCTCPVLDNDHGNGSGEFDADGSPLFWHDGACPIHGMEAE